MKFTEFAELVENELMESIYKKIINVPFSIQFILFKL